MQENNGLPIVQNKDIIYLRAYGNKPNSEPVLLPDVSPVPLWQVPPFWRMTRLSDLTKLAHTQVKKEEEVAALLTALGIRCLKPVNIDVGDWRALVLMWPINQTKDYIVLWRYA